MATSRLVLFTPALICGAIVPTAPLAVPRGAFAGSLAYLSRSAEGQFNEDDARILQSTAKGMLTIVRVNTQAKAKQSPAAQ